MGGGRTGHGKREIVTPMSPPPTTIQATTVIVDSFEEVIIMIHGQGFTDDISSKI